MLLNNSSMYGHVGCFHLSAMMTYAAIDISIQVDMFSFYLGMYLGVELLG